MIHGSLFSGIGGFDLAAEWMGWKNAFHCELNPFGRTILKHYWPHATSYEDITRTDFTRWRGGIDILTGGFPCQPYSTAGKRQGKADARHLWPEMLRAIREIRPRWIVGENVRGFVSWNGELVFREVCTDLEVEGYEVFPVLIPAAGVNAPHKRDRIWFVAHSINNGLETVRQPGSILCNEKASERKGCERFRAKLTDSIESPATPWRWERWPTQSAFYTADDGFPRGLDGITFSNWRIESLKAAGNAIVPQVAHQIFETIDLYEMLY